MTRLIEARTGIHTVVAEDAISCVAEGTGKSLDSLNSMTGRHGEPVSPAADELTWIQRKRPQAAFFLLLSSLFNISPLAFLR